LVEPTLPTIEELRDDRRTATAVEDQAPHSVIEHHVVDDDEWGEIEEIVVYSDAA
jgi:hypothetical protein